MAAVQTGTFQNSNENCPILAMTVDNSEFTVDLAGNDFTVTLAQS